MPHAQPLSVLGLRTPRLMQGMLLLACMFFVRSSAPFAAAADEALAQGFARPPGDVRPLMRWWWFGPAVDKAELERELILMKEGGLGGVEVQPVYALSLDDASRKIKNTPYLSPEFLESLRFTAEKTRELGLRMDLTLGSGWPYGGPHTPIELASARVRFERVRVNVDQKRIPLPPIGAGEKLIAAFAGKSLRELTDIHDEALWLNQAESAAKEIWFFIASRTGQMVKRASVGAEGFVLDHYSRPALEKHLSEVANPLLEALGPNLPYSVFCDSLEVYSADWTENLLEEFSKRRGYDLRPWLPALVSDIGPETKAVRHDWSRTLTELCEDSFTVPLHDWAKAHHAQLRMQCYGVPPVIISSQRYADLNEGEGETWNRFSTSRWASSASHIYGRAVTSSETWTWLHSPVFRATPLDMKYVADLNFLEGINQLIGHGWPYTPPSVEYPGWRFYAAAVFDEKNPWYGVAMADLSSYLSRVSFLLRQGQPLADVAVYLPNDDAWAAFSCEPRSDDQPVGRSLPSVAQSRSLNMSHTQGERVGTEIISQLLDSGHNFDFFDDVILQQNGTFDEDSLVLGHAKYRAVILPSVERIPLATIKRLEEFSKNGGLVFAVGRRPELPPGLLEQKRDGPLVQETSQRLFGSSGSAGIFLADANALGVELIRRLPADFSVGPKNGPVGFVHRRADAGEIYFVANTENRSLDLKATFRVNGLKAEEWNALTGQRRQVAVDSGQAKISSVALKLAPYESKIFVFVKNSSLPLRPLAQTGGSLDLSRSWDLIFGDERSGVTMDELHPWTDDAARLYFSGVVHYRKKFSLSAKDLTTGTTWQLDFGEGHPRDKEAYLREGHAYAKLDAPIREAAALLVNSHRAGSLWAPPYVLDVTPFLKEGENEIQIDVANLAVNHMAGHSQPDYSLLNSRYGLKFDPQDMDQIKAEPAGLVSTVHLRSMRGGGQP